MKIVLIERAPENASGDVLAGAAGRRLASLAGLDLADFLDRFERRSVLPNWAGSEADGDEFPIDAAKKAADKLRKNLKKRRVVLLGRDAAAAFRLVPDDYQWFQPLEIPPNIEAAVMPHPSGISHWWNDPDNVERARDFMLRVRLATAPDLHGQVSAALEHAAGIRTAALDLIAQETGHRVSRSDLDDLLRDHPELADGVRPAVPTLDQILV